jgi:glycosyltransferase involved in cell wall biosynthesis
MRIMMFAESLSGTGGIQRSTLQVASHLMRKGHQLSLIHGEDGDLSSAWADVTAARVGMESVQLPRRSPVKAAKRRLAAWRFAREEQPQVLYCHSMNQLPLAIFLARRTGVPLVFHLRTPVPVISRRNRRRMSFPSSFISVSESTKTAWSRLRPDLSAHCEVIPNGVDLHAYSQPSSAEREEARTNLDLSPSSAIAAFVGRVTPEKGVIDLIRAHKSLPPDSQPWLVVVGSGLSDGDQEYEALVRREAGSRTKFLGYQDSAANVIKAADVVVLPSHAEAFGRVVIESLACGVPVIGSNVGGIPEILSADFADLLFNVGDTAHLAELLATSTRADFASSRAERCREVAQRYDSDSCHQRVEAVLQRVVDEGSR